MKGMITITGIGIGLTANLDGQDDPNAEANDADRCLRAIFSLIGPTVRVMLEGLAEQANLTEDQFNAVAQGSGVTVTAYFPPGQADVSNIQLHVDQTPSTFILDDDGVGEEPS